MGLLASRAAWEGYSPEERDRRMLLVLPTTNLGAQRWTANRVEFGAGKVERARDLIAAALNSTMSAQPLVGAFVGGPEGIGMEEWERAISAASLMPLWSVEGLPTGRDREAAVELVRAAAEMRWQLLPYLYTQAFAMFYEGQPLLRPLVLARPDDPALRGTETAYMMGPDLLVAPALGEDTFEPDEHFAGVWERLPIGTADERLPRIYMRRGSIIPLAQPGQRPGGMELDPVTIVVALDEQGEAVGTLYEDEQETYSLFRGQTRRLTYRAKREGEVAFVRLAGLDGGWGLPRRQLSVRLLMESGEIDAVGTERGTMRIELGTTPGAP